MTNFYKVIISLIVLVICLKCKKVEDDVLNDNRNVLTFDDSNFTRFNSTELNSSDFLVNANGDIYIVGVGLQEQSSSIRQPFILKLNSQKEIINLEFRVLDDKPLFRNVLISSTNNENLLFITNSDPESDSDFDLNLIQINKEGITDWAKTLMWEGPREVPSSVIQLENNDFIILCEVQKEFGMLNSDNFLLIRITQNGEIIWINSIEDEFILQPKQLIHLKDQNRFVVLTEHSINGDFTKSQLKIHSFDINGFRLSTQLFPTSQDLRSHAANLTLTKNNKLFLMYSANENLENKNYDIFIHELDLNLNSIRQISFQGSKTDTPVNIIHIFNDEYVMLSNTRSFGNGESDVMLTKFKLDGEIIWDKAYGSPLADGALNFVKLENDNFLIVGNSNHLNQNESIFDVFILETNSEGNPI